MTTTHSSAGNPRVSLTGYATASAWTHFGFEHAQWFSTLRGRALFLPLHLGCRALRRFAPGPGAFTETLYWRHHWFSEWAARQCPGLAIEIGAGLSTRGIAHAARNPQMHWVDYDLPDMVHARANMLASRDLPANYTLEPGDLLAPGLGAQLTAPSRGSVIAMTEGVTDYLDRNEKPRAWQNISSLLKRLGGGRYLLEIYPRDRIAAFGPAAGVVLDALRRISGRNMLSQLCSSTDEAIGLLENNGFSRARVLPESELADAGRAPPPSQRAFVLIEAQT